MYKSLLITLGVISLSACSEQLDNQVFTCDNQQTAIIANNSDEKATLKYDHQQYQLVRQRSASGVKYSSDDVLFWTKEKEAMLIINGNKHHCKLE